MNARSLQAKSEELKAPRELLKAQSLANTLDYAVKLPLVNFRIGLDSIVGLIPGVGDAIMLLASLRIIYLGKKMGVPKPLLAAMIRNSAIDFALGFIPLVGDIVDIFFKANIRNVRIMEKYWVSQNKAAIDAMTQEQLEDWKAKQE